jgi:hypothetical protein
MSAIIVPIDRALPCALSGEPSRKQEQPSLSDRWLFEPASDSAGLTLKDYRQRLVLHAELAKLLQSGSTSIASNLKMMKRLFRLHQEMRTALEARGMA